MKKVEKNGLLYFLDQEKFWQSFVSHKNIDKIIDALISKQEYKFLDLDTQYSIIDILLDADIQVDFEGFEEYLKSMKIKEPYLQKYRTKND